MNSRVKKYLSLSKHNVRSFGNDSFFLAYPWINVETQSVPNVKCNFQKSKQPVSAVCLRTLTDQFFFNGVFVSSSNLLYENHSFMKFWMFSKKQLLEIGGNIFLDKYICRWDGKAFLSISCKAWIWNSCHQARTIYFTSVIWKATRRHLQFKNVIDGSTSWKSKKKWKSRIQSDWGKSSLDL